MTPRSILEDISPGRVDWDVYPEEKGAGWKRYPLKNSRPAREGPDSSTNDLHKYYHAAPLPYGIYHLLKDEFSPGHQPDRQVGIGARKVAKSNKTTSKKKLFY